MGESLGSMVDDSELGSPEVRSYWRSWLVALMFCVVWFGVTSMAIILTFLALSLIGISEAF